ncbi:hypothetical protein [Streptomyces sp. NPDC002132]|uniref:hypothetical protein n=1 Tax=unclassified Streptomyces TaxID=2593676 RepID=UPI003327B3AF
MTQSDIEVDPEDAAAISAYEEALRDFTTELNQLHIAFGAPSYATLAKASVSPKLTKAGLHDALSGKRLPSLEALREFVRVVSNSLPPPEAPATYRARRNLRDAWDARWQHVKFLQRQAQSPWKRVHTTAQATLDQALQEAETIRAAAHEEAARIRADAQHQAETLRTEAASDASAAREEAALHRREAQELLVTARREAERARRESEELLAAARSRLGEGRPHHPSGGNSACDNQRRETHREGHRRRTCRSSPGLGGADSQLDSPATSHGPPEEDGAISRSDRGSAVRRAHR